MLEKEESVLVVVDIQDILMPKSVEVVEEYLAKAEKLIRVALALDIPVLTTEQNPQRLGATNARILEALGDTPRIPKMEFGCMANKTFSNALEATGRNQLLLIGMETHVCVMQTAVQALDEGYEVFVVSDAVVSARKSDYKAGLRRMEQEEVLLVSTEMAIFEWLREAGTPEFKGALPFIKS